MRNHGKSSAAGRNVAMPTTSATTSDRRRSSTPVATDDAYVYASANSGVVSTRTPAARE